MGAVLGVEDLFKIYLKVFLSSKQFSVLYCSPNACFVSVEISGVS